MTGHGTKFGRKREEAIVALLSQPTIEQAARAAGIGPKTLLRWMQVPEFQAALRNARRDAFGQATARLQQGSSAAATTMLRIMLDKDTPASCRLRAADSVMQHAAKAIELEEIEARVAALEAASGKDGARR
jgi:transposase-like protein